jgi:hypothetical protein
MAKKMLQLLYGEGLQQIPLHMCSSIIHSTSKALKGVKWNKEEKKISGIAGGRRTQKCVCVREREREREGERFATGISQN